MNKPMPLNPREVAAAAQPTAAKAEAVYNGPGRFDSIGRKSPQQEHPAPQFRHTPRAAPRVDVGAAVIAKAKGGK